MMETKKINIGVSGCGQMGMEILRRLIKVSPNLSVAALYDPDERSINKARKELKNEHAVCSSYDEMLKMNDLDWIMIASWNSLHCEQTVAALETGINVFCQKPLAINIDEVIQMQNAWQQSGKMFSLGFTLRYSPHYRKIKQLISEGSIGEIVSMEFNETLDFNHGGFIMGDWRRLRKNSGTHLLEKTSHDIDLANWMVNSLPSRVASFGGLSFFKPDNDYHVSRLGKNKNGKSAYSAMEGLINKNPFHSEKDIVDNQVAIIEYQNGVRATFHTNINSAIPERRMYILGTEGAIRANVLTGEIQLRRIGFKTPFEDRSTKAKGMHGDGDNILVKELAASMLDGSPPSAGLMEGVTSSVTCFAIDDAMDKGIVVEMDPYWEKVGIK